MKKLIFFFVLVLCSLSQAESVKAQTVINSFPFTISAPGTYVLTQDFTFPLNEPLIALDTSVTPLTGPVIIDFQGHTVTAGPAPYNYECVGVRNNVVVQPKQPSITIRNGTVVGFSAGIAVLRANVTITNMVFRANDAGILLSESAPSTVSNCFFDGTGSSQAQNSAGISDLGERQLNPGENILSNNTFQNIGYPLEVSRPADLNTPVLISRFKD